MLNEKGRNITPTVRPASDARKQAKLDRETKVLQKRWATKTKKFRALRATECRCGKTVWEVLDYAEKMMERYGLCEPCCCDSDCDCEYWEVDLNPRFSRCLGRCDYAIRTIWLATDFILRGDWLAIEDTITHEICHAIGFRDHSKSFWDELEKMSGRTRAESRALKNGKIGKFRWVCSECGYAYWSRRGETNGYTKGSQYYGCDADGCEGKCYYQDKLSVQSVKLERHPSKVERFWKDIKGQQFRCL